MGASNFARGNTSQVFAVLMNEERKVSICNSCGEKAFEDFDYVEIGGTCYECGSDDIEHTIEDKAPESYDYEDFKEYLRETAKEKAKDTYTYRKQEKSDNDRNYCATDLFSLSTYKMYGDIEVNLTITGQIVSAYYEGASLDYRLEVYNGSEDCEVDRNSSVADILDDLFAPKYDHYNSYMNQGMRRIQMKNATKWAEKETEKMIELIEEIFTEVSMPLTVIAQFSNGETIYAKAI